MAAGHFIRLGDKTTCGGSVLEADSRVMMFGIAHAREGDRVTCGKDGKVYRIIGGVPFIKSHGRIVAGTLHSISSCPCRARFIPSFFQSTYQADSKDARAVAPGPTATAAGAALAGAALISSIKPVTQNPPEEEEEEEELEDTGVVLRLGLFFDGTGDNAQNVQLGAQCQAGELGYSAEDQRAMLARCQDFQRDPLSSYGRQQTNIARLHSLYRDDSNRPDAASQSVLAIPVYAPGVGTRTNQPDITFPDMAMGTGERGVEAQILFVVQEVLRSVRQLAGNTPALQIAEIKVDLFGFSRGAAAARHFLNDLSLGAGSMLARALTAAQVPLTSGFNWQRGQALHIGVLGLFDTVAAIGSLADGWNVHDAQNAGLNLYLAPNCAERVIHLVAADERRYNFSLNSVTPGFTDTVLPGAHGDIGGNYPALMDERLLLTPPYVTEVDKELPDEQSPAYRKAAAALDHWRQYGLIDLHQPNGRLYIDCHSVRSTESPLRRKTVHAQVRLERQVRGEYGRIPLRIMHAQALKAGCPFDPIPMTQEFRLPADLQSIADKLMAAAEGGGAVSLERAERDLLWAHYIHQSDNWNVYPGMSGGLSVQFVDRPTQSGHRARHPNSKGGV